MRNLVTKCVRIENQTRRNMKNRILEALPAKERRLLSMQLSPINLARATVLFEPGDTPEYIYFPLEAMVS